jgi:murein DD-endopeptidase MepM/ murein hydrolase activator NlpD
MSSARRTPRYVDAIHPYERPSSGSADVIRLRPEPVAPSLPPITKAWPRRRAVPVADRPWQLMLVPPTPGAQTRSFNVARWQARLVIASVCTVLIIAAAGATALVLAVRSPDLFATSAEAALLRTRLAVVEDSLAIARAELESPDDSLSVAAAAASGGLLSAAPTSSVNRKPALRPSAPSLRALSRRVSTTSDDEGASLSARGIEGLPVIGAIASRFSRARRHPLLHVVRPHLGVDVAAPRGTKITAPSPGRVTFVGRKFGFGLVVEIQHRDGVSTRYAHCGSALVSEGDQVQKGMAIATVGTSGLSTGPHLHYEVLVRGHQVDPLRFRLPQMGDSAVAGAAPPSAGAVAAPAVNAAATSAAIPESPSPK